MGGKTGGRQTSEETWATWTEAVIGKQKVRRVDVSEVSKTDTGWRGKKVTEGNFLLSRCVADKVGGPSP